MVDLSIVFCKRLPEGIWMFIIPTPKRCYFLGFDPSSFGILMKQIIQFFQEMWPQWSWRPSEPLLNASHSSIEAERDGGNQTPPKQGQRRWFERRVWCSLHLIFGWECLVRGRPTQKSWFSKENKPGSQASWTLVNDGGTNVTGGDPRIFPLKWSLKPEEWSVLAPKSPRDQMVVCWGYVIELAAGASGSKWMPKILDQDSPLLRRSKKPSNCGPRLWNGRLWSLWSVFVGNIC